MWRRSIDWGDGTQTNGDIRPESSEPVPGDDLHPRAPQALPLDPGMHAFVVYGGTATRSQARMSSPSPSPTRTTRALRLRVPRLSGPGATSRWETRIPRARVPAAAK